MIEESSNFIGKLTQTQLYSLFDGYSRYNKKQSDAMKSKGTRQEISNASQMTRVPGVVVKNKKSIKR